MIYIEVFLISLLVLLIIWHFVTLKYLNPYTMRLFIANKGAGKSTTAAKFRQKYIRRYIPVYTNMDDMKINGVRIYQTMDLGHYKVDDRYIQVDEVSLFFDNRNYKTTSKEFIKWLRAVRHHKLRVDLFTQSYDCDKKIRTMCDDIYIGMKYFRVLTIWRRLRKNVAIKEAAMDAESQIVDELKFTPWWQPGSILITYIPKYIKYFDSFKDLQEYDGNLDYHTVTDGYTTKSMIVRKGHGNAKRKNNKK